MADQPTEKDLLSKNYELIADKAKIEVKLASVEGEFNKITLAHDALKTTLDTTQAEFAVVKTELATVLVEKEEFAKKVTDLEAAAIVATEEFTAKVTAAEAVATEAVSFKEAYVAVVEANGVKIASAVTDYASKTVEELKKLNDEFLAEIAKLPSGQQTNDGTEDKPAETYAYDGIPTDQYKTK